MELLNDLQSKLLNIDGRGYKLYKSITGRYRGKEYTIIIDHAQGDPYADASKIRVLIPSTVSCFPEDTFSVKSRQTALCDFITREFYGACRKYSTPRGGADKSGLITIEKPGQEILERTSVFVNGDSVEIRFLMGLPAMGRKIAGRKALKMFFEELPKIIEKSGFYKNLNREKLYRHIKTSEDADFIRKKLRDSGIISFIAAGSILPRKSGIDPGPMDRENAVAFVVPEKYKINIECPNAGTITGMGIPPGISLIVGGGYHGKSTLLNAIENGIYNHIPDDGREFVVTDYSAFKIRAEDGRRIEKTSISPFISNLPLNRSTDFFCSEDASGSTSQAANIIETMEAGCRILLIDEDTSATNFMIRDHRMQELISKDREPITPFIDKAAQLYSEFGISSILVIGGSGDYFDIADHVISMEDYIPRDRTEEAKAIAKKYSTERKKEGGNSFGKTTKRIPIARSIDPSRGKRDLKINFHNLKSIQFGRYHINLASIEQIVETAQTRALAAAIVYAKRYMNASTNLKTVINSVLKDISEKGLDILSPYPSGNLALFRGLELAAAINRLRSLEIK